MAFRLTTGKSLEPRSPSRRIRDTLNPMIGRRTRWFLGFAALLAGLAGLFRGHAAAPSAPPVPLAFAVAAPPGRSWPAWPTRLLVAVAPGSSDGEPWAAIEKVGPGEITVLGIDVPASGKPGPVVLDHAAAISPWNSLGELPPGKYRAQALLMTNRDLWRPDAPGNWIGEPRGFTVDRRRAGTLRLPLDGMLPAEVLPPESDLVRFRKIRSEKLSAFWGREMFVRVGIVLPRGFDAEAERRYPLVVHVGGYGARFDRVAQWAREGNAFRRDWMAYDTPRMVLVALDGAGPLGDPYQVDSENHGPWGAALVEEILPALEREFRGMGRPWARFTMGGSTGGWVSFALQVLYPDRFGGCWSGYPDPVDFRDFQRVNLHADANAFVESDGRERASARLPDGRTQFTMRHEVRHENVLGLGDSYTRGGGQWGAWNATFGPRAADGTPAAVWDPRTGRIDPAVVRAWSRYDLVPLLAAHWATLGPKLRGKIHVWVGEDDAYFLNHAVHRLDVFLREAQPPADARILFGPGRGHGWEPVGWAGRLKEMQAVVDRGAVDPGESAREAYFRGRFPHPANCPHCKGGP
ncbi:MAG: esterase family protein [Verrucomicrobia bacterium]|nr:MAG: esterase family protein [Verrucomicrobiota bacterium]